MQKIYSLIAVMSCILLSRPAAFSQTQKPTGYDSTLAQKLHADEYGMKKYVLVLLKTGPATGVSKPKSDSLFMGHMNNINRLADEGKLAVAGPFFKNDSYRGLFILNAESLDEARKLVETDPAVKAKLLDFEMFLWYGSAALGETAEIHKKIARKDP